MSGGPIATRIVSLVPSSTESICSFGAASRLVGCTRYCTEPKSGLAGVARIGGTKNPDREAILRLQPDLVVANGEENRREDLEWLADRVPLLIQTPRTIRAAVACLHELAQRLGVAAAAGAFADVVAACLSNQRTPPEPRLRVFYAIWARPWMGTGCDTFVHDVLTTFGVENAAAGSAARYPEVDPAALVAAGLDVVLLASEPWSFDVDQQAALAVRGPFGGARLVLCDGRDFCWHGVHMAVGLPRVAALLASLR